MPRERELYGRSSAVITTALLAAPLVSPAVAMGCLALRASNAGRRSAAAVLWLVLLASCIAGFLLLPMQQADRLQAGLDLSLLAAGSILLLLHGLCGLLLGWVRRPGRGREAALAIMVVVTALFIGGLLPLAGVMRQGDLMTERALRHPKLATMMHAMAAGRPNGAQVAERAVDIAESIVPPPFMLDPVSWQSHEDDVARCAAQPGSAACRSVASSEHAVAARPTIRDRLNIALHLVAPRQTVSSRSAWSNDLAQGERMPEAAPRAPAEH